VNELKKGTPSWIWPSVGPSSLQAHTEPESFESRAITNLIREVAQNSIDASNSNDQNFAEMEFTIHKDVKNLGAQGVYFEYHRRSQSMRKSIKTSEIEQSIV
jgi:hypothetical protein